MKNNAVTEIKAISFDGDGTLWDFEKVMRHSLRHVLRELERIDVKVTSRLTIERMIAIRNETAEEMRGITTNLEEIRLEAFRRTLQEAGFPDEKLAKHCNDVYLKHRFEDMELFDDVLLVLNTLRANFRLALISNGNSYPERIGLDGMFTSVIFSQDYRVEKPDPALFRIALNELKCTEQNLLHIGDSLTSDIEGAKRSGIQNVWLNRLRAENKLNIEPDYEISTLSELPGILGY